MCSIGLKKKVCSNMTIEIIKQSNNSRKIYTYLNELLNRNVSPLILRLLSVLYTNQTLQVKWKLVGKYINVSG